MKANKPDKFKNLTGVNIRNVRTKSKLSQVALASKVQALGVELTSKEISKIETNNRLVQDFELLALAKVLDVPVDVFFEGVD